MTLCIQNGPGETAPARTGQDSESPCAYSSAGESDWTDPGACTHIHLYCTVQATVPAGRLNILGKKDGTRTHRQRPSGRTPHVNGAVGPYDHGPPSPVARGQGAHRRPRPDGDEQQRQPALGAHPVAVLPPPPPPQAALLTTAPVAVGAAAAPAGAAAAAVAAAKCRGGGRGPPPRSHRRVLPAPRSWNCRGGQRGH